MSDNQNNQEKDGLKQKKKFENSWKRMLSLTENPTPEKEVKFPQNEVTEIFGELAKERMETAKKEFKAKLTVALEGKLALDKELRRKRKELEKQEEIEYQKLNVLLDDAFKFIEGKKKENNDLLAAAEGNANPADDENNE